MVLLFNVAKNFREYVVQLNGVSTLSGMLLITEVGINRERIYQASYKLLKWL